MNDWKAALETHKIELTAVAACLALTAGVYLLGVGPLLEAHAQSVEQKDVYRRGVERARAVAAQRRQLEDNLAQVEAELATSAVRLESSTTLNSRVARINQLVSRIGARVDEIRPGAICDYPRFRTVPIRLAGEADFATFTLLVEQIRGEFPDTAITELEVVKDVEAETPRFRVQLVWYASAVDTIAGR